MNSKGALPRIFVWAAAIVLILAVIAAVTIRQADQSRADIPVLGTVPDFQYVNQNGDVYGAADLEGKITVLDFIFTSCQGACPRMSSRMAELYNRFSATDRVQFVSVSVDPARDSLAALRSYAERYGVTDDRWMFLRAPLDSVKWLSRKGFNLSDEFPAGHSTRFVLIDRKRNIRGYYRSDDKASLETLTTHITELVKW